jgi:ADP-heptose:LPS heptosyltransferase
MQFPRSDPGKPMEHLLLENYQCPGDILMLTAAVRDLHRATHGQYLIDIRSTCGEIWANNPYLTPSPVDSKAVRRIYMHCTSIDYSNQRPYHFIHGFVQHLESNLGVDIPVTEFRGDIHLSPTEKLLDWNQNRLIADKPNWLLIVGGKYDFTAKWYNPASLQKVVDHFRGRIQFVQCGEASHWHPRLEGVIDMVGKTTIRQFIQLMYHADGVVCPVTFAMHLAAAVEMPPGKPKHRPCVVLGGGREPPHWEAYPFHQYISTVGMLPCCDHGGCWRSRCQLVGDGDEKDRVNVCERPVQITPDLRIPQCMEMIRPEDVIRRIEMYLERERFSEATPPLAACETCP